MRISYRLYGKHNGYRVFPGGKVRPGRAADYSTPSSTVVMEEYSYTSTHPLGHNRACNGNTIPFRLRIIYKLQNIHSGCVSTHYIQTGCRGMQNIQNGCIT